MEQQLEAGPVWENTGYVFTQAIGAPIDPDMVSKDFPELVKRAGLPHLTLHGLRHANATLFQVAGVSPKVVSERLGHSNIAITMDTYSHVIPGMQEEAAAIFNQVLQVKRPPANF
jgi:integrase